MVKIISSYVNVGDFEINKGILGKEFDTMLEIFDIDKKSTGLGIEPWGTPD